ncbi:cellulose synthase/poly-beta-1,6-N-acetylglucosamine synthase-like glycosyltransferase [Microlunatus panaciterrae]|uniref:Cellulose synthase/poly-beta-1,6-N-acetylglucosamine synthase-like glycosyltransferase n=2 Tax=Microlunatus panaciterrae TaxID=400768 RepID=A0ABS2RHT1_9ACTN|nr:cellulose synthase/poly-beta-1,6-N-acetylglucosamine synthase-like glycosyltransferase [Microlunatus panaciterrae]
MVMAVCGLALAWVALKQPGPVVSVVAALAVPVVAYGLGWSRRQILVSALSLGSFVAVVDYLSWRTTVINWSAWWISLPLLIAEAFGALHAVGIAWTVWPRPEKPWQPTADATELPIFVLIPTVNEGVDVVGPTIDAALLARSAFQDRYPHASVTIVVCNDGRVANWNGWRDVERLAKSRGVVHVARQVGGGAKAGNIEHARRLLNIHGNALLVVFDADQIAEPEFLLATVPVLDDEQVAWVQTSQTYRNLDNPVARWAEHQQAIFYKILCPGKARQNSAFICGTNVVIRAAALDEIGGFPQDSVTEDFAASLRLHARWRSVFVPGVLARGLGPMDLRSYFGQQRRWAIGTLGALRTNGRQIFWPSRTGLSLEQRVQYGLAATHYLGGLKDLIFVLAPLVFLVTAIPAVSGATLGDFINHFLPYLIFSQGVLLVAANGKTSWRGLVMGFASFPVLVGSLVTVLAGRRIGFAVTAKSRAAGRQVGHVLPHLVGLGICLAVLAFSFATGRVGAAQLVSLVWVGYSLLSFSVALGLALADVRGLRLPSSGQQRPSVGQRLRVLARVLPRRRRRYALAAGTATLALLAVATVALPNLDPSAAAAFEPSAKPSELKVGLALAGDAPPSGSIALGRKWDLIGRTQQVDEPFDLAWMSSRRQEGTTPWITLVFGTGGDDLDSGLPAIVNGTHDGELRRWADQARAFGGPIYLTVLPQVDRSWAATTAVAHGGIPADVGPAWSHVRELFRSEGANNVAFVWAPADPDSDQLFAPAANQVDAVLLSLISYPGTSWADPDRAITAVQARHPGKAVLLEISAAGSDSAKATWISKAVHAAQKNGQVRALIYHQAPPDGSKDPRWPLLPGSSSARSFEAASVSGTAGTEVQR